MTTKKKPEDTKSIEKKTLQISQEKDKTQDRQFAEISLSPSTLNTLTAVTFAKGVMGEISITDAVAVMKDNINKVNINDIKELEGTLTAQAIALNSIFNELARRAALNMGTHMQATESYMRLALKAQAQCARTIEVLAAMKNPPIVYAKQANISNGNQQVNNGSVSNGQPFAHTGKTINNQNELLSEDKHEAMDTGGTATTSGTNKAMATLET
jgi:hypothetical protein